eukprot:2087176-Rhodomonas_salina.2
MMRAVTVSRLHGARFGTPGPSDVASLVSQSRKLELLQSAPAASRVEACGLPGSARPPSATGVRVRDHSQGPAAEGSGWLIVPLFMSASPPKRSSVHTHHSV